MCRWLAYSGPPVFLDSLILQPENSLIAQSLHALESLSTTNGDGFGIGWFDSQPTPGLFRETLPAWNDQNLINISQQVRSRLFFAHVRSSTGTTTARSNCHPFRFGNWLFMHNGMVSGFERLRRDLAMMIAPELFARLEGTTDSEVLFYLLLTNGLREDPAAAIETTLARTLAAMRDRGIDGPLRVTAAITDGEAIYAVRYASDGKPPSLYYGCGLDAVPGAAPTPDADWNRAVLVLSEPLDERRDKWVGVPEGRLLVARDGAVRLTPIAAPVPETGQRMVS